LNPALKTIATTHTAFDGQVTFYMLPYIPLAYNETLRQLSNADFVEVRDGRYWGSTNIMDYSRCAACTIDVEFADTLNEDARTFQLFWCNRTRNASENWQFACAALSANALVEWINAYDATRGGTASEDEQDTGETDPKEGSSTS